MNCDIESCKNDPKFRIVLLLSPSKKDSKLKMEEQYIPVQTRLEICTTHKMSGKVTFNTLISDKGWVKICDALKGMKYQIPDRKNSTIAYREIDSDTIDVQKL